MADLVRIQVLMRPDDARRFAGYCQARGHKKSTLIALLIRDHLDKEEAVAFPRRSGARR